MLHLNFFKLNRLHFIIVIVILTILSPLLLIEHLNMVITIIIVNFIAFTLPLITIILANTVVLLLSMVLDLLFFNEYTRLIIIYLLHQSPSQVPIRFLVLRDFIILINKAKQIHTLKLSIFYYIFIKEK